MFCHIRWFSVRKLELSGEGIVNARPQREEVNQPPLCIPTISQPIHERQNIRLSMQLQESASIAVFGLKKSSAGANTALRSDADP